MVYVTIVSSNSHNTYIRNELGGKGSWKWTANIVCNVIN